MKVKEKLYLKEKPRRYGLRRVRCEGGGGTKDGQEEKGGGSTRTTIEGNPSGKDGAT